jgi:RNA polymerase sigma-70 factor, ECF subfamily
MGEVGGSEEIGRAIAAHRNYLLLVANRTMTRALKAKEGASDLVQEAMLAAHRASAQFGLKSAVELRSWLRRLLLNRVAHAARRYVGTQKRRMAREVSLDAVPEGAGVAADLAADQTSPGGLAARREEEAMTRAALDRLPERMRHAVLWRHHDGCGFEEIGRRLGCSDVAARKLWLRALERLQRELSGDPPPD